MGNKDIYSKLTQLGAKTENVKSPDEAVLEKVENPYQKDDYVIRFTAPEFTSLCPITNQPDFAHIVIDYIANQYILESKSLKLFLGSFRNHGSFHESCTMNIAKRIERDIKPKWLRIGGYWYPRGGITIDIFYQTGEIPKSVFIPKQEVSNHRGRG